MFWTLWFLLVNIRIECRLSCRCRTRHCHTWTSKFIISDQFIVKVWISYTDNFQLDFIIRDLERSSFHDALIEVQKNLFNFKLPTLENSMTSSYQSLLSFVHLLKSQPFCDLQAIFGKGGDGIQSSHKEVWTHLRAFTSKKAAPESIASAVSTINMQSLLFCHVAWIYINKYVFLYILLLNVGNRPCLEILAWKLPIYISNKSFFSRRVGSFISKRI